MVKDNDIHVTPHGAFVKHPANDKGKQEIFKLQRPTVTSADQELMLVYNRDRSWQGQLPMTQELFTFFGDSYKKYVVGIGDAHGRLQIIAGIVPDEPF